jgi:murein DD-endopeptidase MepM/ murein hydrolase activator NlpD
MTRLGWTFLVLAVLCAAAFLSMTRFGGPATARSGSGTVTHVEDMVRERLARFRGGATIPPGLAVPVQGVDRAAIVDTWGQARGQGRQHHGTDIPAPAGTPVLAAADGTVEKLFQSQLGGTTLYERTPDRRWTLYYAHLAAYAAGLAEGQLVRAGQVIGYVGDSGDAGAGNYHLHFAVQRTTPDQQWYQGEDVNAYPLLARGPAAR